MSSLPTVAQKHSAFYHPDILSWFTPMDSSLFHFTLTFFPSLKSPVLYMYIKLSKLQLNEVQCSLIAKVHLLYLKIQCVVYQCKMLFC